ncbi:MAG: hypothetical protein H6R05_1271, partial [Burkholderiaceae bacterium]|nr:hypothetical protein [Burkholderiaceae bacterium]
MSQIQVIIKDGQEQVSTVEAGAGKQGKTLTIKAKNGVNYELKDLGTQHAPEEVLLTRKGKNLLIKFKVEGEEFDKDAPADVVLEDYYDTEDSELIGLAENGEYYSYVPQEGDPSFLSSSLNDGMSSYQSLGYATPEASNNFAYLLGALALGGLGALAASGGSDSSSPAPDTTPPAAPVLNVRTNDDGSVTISGSTEPGAAVTITYPDGTTTTVKADSNGNYGPVTSEPDQPSGNVTAGATDPSGNTGPTTVVPYIDTTAPEAPTVTVTTNSNGSVDVSGTAEPGSTVTVTFPDGTTATATTNASGNYG